MYSIFKNPPSQIAVGAYLIGVTVVSYIGMHFVFFGVPHFAATQLKLVGLKKT